MWVCEYVSDSEMEHGFHWSLDLKSCFHEYVCVPQIFSNAAMKLFAENMDLARAVANEWTSLPGQNAAAEDVIGSEFYRRVGMKLVDIMDWGYQQARVDKGNSATSLNDIACHKSNALYYKDHAPMKTKAVWHYVSEWNQVDLEQLWYHTKCENPEKERILFFGSDFKSDSFFPHLQPGANISMTEWERYVCVVVDIWACVSTSISEVDMYKLIEPTQIL